MKGSERAEIASKGRTDRARAHGLRRLAPPEPTAATADRIAGPEVRAADHGACAPVGARRQGVVQEALAERLADDPVLLTQVSGRVALAGACPPRPPDVAERHARRARLFQPVPNGAPRA